jgi:DNA adenine methylase
MNQLDLLPDQAFLPTKITRPALKYMGGKFRLRRWIHQFFPRHLTYLSAFGGGANDFLDKPIARHEIYCDLNSRTHNFFEQLKKRPKELIAAINATCPSRAEVELGWVACPENELEDARRYFIYSLLSYGGGGSRWNSGAGLDLENRFPDGKIKAEYLWPVHRRMAKVAIWSLSALDAIAANNQRDCLIYADPPYLNSTRGAKTGGDHTLTRNQYAHEMTDDDHEQLLDALNKHAGMAVLSGYPSAFYNERLPSWYQVHRSSRDVSGQTKTECLWINPLAYRRSPWHIQELLSPTFRQKRLCFGD